MFEHSVKVPRHYKIAANIFKKVSTEGGSVKTLLYDEKLKHFRTNVLYALLTETIKHAVDLEKIFESCGLLANEPRLDPWLAKVLAAELLFGKKALPGKSKPIQTVLSYKEQFETLMPEQQDDVKSKVVHRPRYVRINTSLLATSDAIRAFQDEGYKFIRCTSGSYDDYLQQIQNLSEYDFTQDYHVKTMFIFAPGTKLHEHDLYLENQIILQDKATALAVHLLAPPPGSVILDMCAAPGMKTTQLAAYLRNQGKIYAVERNENRYQTLCDFVTRTGSKCVETLHKDALEIKRGDCDDVEYILLDPSCSGSGMDLHVHNYIEDTRLARLTSLQEKFLKHAMNSFPNAKRIVYSTCSLFPEENERVITNVVKTSRAKWRVQDIKEILKGQWNNFGSGMYGSMGTRCLYAIPESDLTTGFFVAVLDRDLKDLEKCQEENKGKLELNGHCKIMKSKNDIEWNDDRSSVKEEIEEEVKEKRKKYKKSKQENDVTDFGKPVLDDSDKKTDFEIKVEMPDDIEEEIKQKRKKDKKKEKNKGRSVNIEDNVNISELIPKLQNENNDEVKSKKKNKKRKRECFENLNDEDNNDNIQKSEPIFEDADDIDNVAINAKKKKKKIKELISNEILTQEKNSTNKYEKKSDVSLEQSYDPNNENTSKLKKKKKKDKVHNSIENNESITYIPVTVEDIDKKCKKKKKDKEHFELNSEESTFDNANNNLNKERKNKSKHSDITETNVIDEVPKKTKKKHKDL